ncbi:MAG: hypothetical protein WB770_10775 [Acidimicrobiales bacterium]
MPVGLAEREALPLDIGERLFIDVLEATGDVVGISVSGGPSTVDVTDLAAELGIHSGSPPAVLDSH